MGYEAEQRVIGALLANTDAISEIYHILEAEMFTDEFLGRVYLEFQRGYDRHYQVDIAVLEQKLSSEYQKSVVIDKLVGCSSSCFTSVFVVTDANVILNDYKALELNRFINSINVTGGNVNEKIPFILEQIEGIQGERQTKSKTLAEITKENKVLYFKEREIQPLQIGLPTLDDMLGGLEGGDMIVIGARPSVGKSALVTQITSNLAKQGKRVGFYNLEMADKQVYERFVSSESGIGMTRLRRAIKFLGDEKERFERANEVLEKAENIVLTTGSKSPSEIRAESRHMKYDIIIIDYLQLLRPDTSYRGNRTSEVGAISRAIKALAMEFNIPIIALSQLNRLSEAKESKEPTMGELREAGDIEQDASVIMLLWNLDEDRILKGCKIEKNRQGECGKVTLRFDGEHMRFVETTETTAFKKAKYDECPFE